MKTIIFAALLVTGCAAASPGGPMPGSLSLAGSAWESADDPAIYIRFDGEGNLSGSGGCNSIGASYVQDGEVLTIGPVRATRKACDIPIMDAEQAFLAALEATERVGMEGDDRLVLRDANGGPVVTLQRRAAD